MTPKETEKYSIHVPRILNDFNIEQRSMSQTPKHIYSKTPKKEVNDYLGTNEDTAQKLRI